MPKGIEHDKYGKKKAKLSFKEKRLRKKEKKMKNIPHDVATSFEEPQQL